MKKNKIIKAFVVDSEMDEELNKICKELGFKKTNIIRFLLNRALAQLKAEGQKAGGYSHLEFSFKDVK